MQAQEEKAPVTDAYLDDFEEFLEEEDRWKPGVPRPHDRQQAFRKRKGKVV